jgi:hypothetical protein
MHWNEGANVCGPNEESSRSAVAASKPETQTKKSTSKKHGYRKRRAYSVRQTQTTEHHPLRGLFRNVNKKTTAKQ